MVDRGAQATADQHQPGAEHIEQGTEALAEPLAVALPHLPGLRIAGGGAAVELRWIERTEPGQGSDAAVLLEGAPVAGGAGRPLGINPDQAEFGAGSIGAGEQRPTDQNAAAHAGAEGEQDRVGTIHRRPPPSLTEQGTVGIVGEHHRSLDLGFKPVGQGDAAPTRQVDRQPGDAPIAIGGARQSDAHPVGPALWIEGRHRLHHRLAHGPRHLGLGRGHVELGEQVSPPVEAAELDGGAADVDAEELGGGRRRGHGGGRGLKAEEASAQNDHNH